ncbi:MAG TPA: type II toxin-antitoxin system HicB family antitoxin [Beijerinckiaceae bacterium]|nr:type II toxin-antitoxin system HicB family antitoxin [Beijerinckiaceae bacterium]
MLAYFVCILEGDGDNWGARIFDIDGCVGAGSTPDEAIAGVTEALRDVIDHMRNDNHPVPSPSNIAHVLASGEVRAGEHLVLVPLWGGTEDHALAGA